MEPAMKVLLAVVSCHLREELSDLLRSTWIPLVPKEVDVRIFRGRGAKRDPLEDEVFLNCGDGYLDLPEKVQAIFSWAYDHGYDYCAKCDDDVILRPKAWFEGFSRVDFSGWQDPACKEGEIKTPWGFLYTLSSKAMRLVIDAKLPGVTGSLWNRSHGNDEAFVSSVLHYSGVFLTHDPNHLIWQGDRTIVRCQPKRPLRRSSVVPVPVVAPNVYAVVVYLKWTVKDVSTEMIIKEFNRIWNTIKTQEGQCVGS